MGGCSSPHIQVASSSVNGIRFSSHQAHSIRTAGDQLNRLRVQLTHRLYQEVVINVNAKPAVTCRDDVTEEKKESKRNG